MRVAAIFAYDPARGAMYVNGSQNVRARMGFVRTVPSDGGATLDEEDQFPKDPDLAKSVEGCLKNKLRRHSFPSVFGHA